MIPVRVRAALVLGLGAALAACAVGPQVRKLPDGGYRIACDATLSSCLGAFETVCAWHGYDVISATERRRRLVPGELHDETITSEAEVRCKSGDALFGVSPAPPPAAPAAPAPAPAPPPTVEPSVSVVPDGVCGVPAADGGAPASCGEGPASPAPDPPR